MDSNRNSKEWSRRSFLQTVGATVPTLTMLKKGANIKHTGTSRSTVLPAEKFTPIDLNPYFNASAKDFGPREMARKRLHGDSARDGLIRTPWGRQNLQGIPFLLGPEGVDKKSWLWLTTRTTPSAARNATIPLGQTASFLCLATFCDWDENETSPPVEDVIEKVGQHLAEAVVIYDDDSEISFPLRRRFEVNSPEIFYGHPTFNSLPHRQPAPASLDDPLRRGTDWGGLQTSVQSNYEGSGPLGTLWVCALNNPQPERTLRALRLQGIDEDPLIVCGLTLYRGDENPLRYGRLMLYRFTLPEATAAEEGRWKVSVDLGVVARTFIPSEFEPEAWLSAPGRGLGGRHNPGQTARHLYAEVTASRDATLELKDTKTDKRYEFDLRQVMAGKELEARPAGAWIEILQSEKVWLHGQVIDRTTGRPTPVRLAFRSKEGRYIPPYGHRTEINEGWFQDYGADLKLMDTSFAYVDGSFQVELPVGEVYLEMTKGFEYEAVRKRLSIEPGQRELNLEIVRHADLRSQGWVTADTHVHFLPPSTAILEGQAEDLNLVNLLAAQWGDLFTNVGDLPHGPLTSRDGQTVVWVGTENRQYILGHVNLLGGHGEPVYPFSAGGPGESYLGDPVWTSLADWADACRQREGLVVFPHFPYQNTELPADVVLNKIDAVELTLHLTHSRPTLGEHFNTVRFYDWYRYLNCGYRLPAVGGTDKMGAYMPVGANRTYANIGREEFSFANWAKAVRKGNTFMTTGPLLLFQVDGRVPGEEITLGAGGGTVEVDVEATCFVPFHRLEVILNGHVVATREDSAGTRQMSIKERVHVAGPGWIAARCASRLEPITRWGISILAHTSPVYLHVPGQELFSAPAAAYMLTLIEGTQTWLENLATQPDPERFERVRKTLAEAREVLHRRMHRHAVQH